MSYVKRFSMGGWLGTLALISLGSCNPASTVPTSKDPSANTKGGGPKTSESPSSDAVSQTDADDSDEFETPIASTPISGASLAKFENTRMKCDFTGNQSAGKVVCRLTVLQPNDSELVALKVDDDNLVSWPASPSVLKGSVTVSNCKVQKGDLGMTCEYSNASEGAILLSTINLTKPSSGATRSESAEVVLNYSVAFVGGFVPALLASYEGLLPASSASPEAKVGIVPNSIGMNDLNPPSTPICSIGQKTFFMHTFQTYYAENNRIYIYAGRNTNSGTQDLSHRLRMITGSQLACYNDHLYMSATGTNRAIYRFEDDGSVSKIAGTGTNTGSPDGTLATEANLDTPGIIAFGPTGELFFFEASTKLRKIKLDGTIETVAGTGVAGTTGDGGLATAAKISSPAGLVITANGDIYYSESTGCKIRKIGTDGIINTIAGNGTCGYTADGVLASTTKILPKGLAYNETAKILYVAGDTSYRLRAIDENGIISTVAGTGTSGYSGDGGPATSAMIKGVSYIGFAPNGNLLLVDYSNTRIREIDSSGNINTWLGGAATTSSNGTAAENAVIGTVNGITYAPNGDIIFTDTLVRKIDANGVYSTIGGVAGATLLGDGGPATSAKVSSPKNVVVNSAGEIIFADYGQHRIRKIDVNGNISTIVGTGTSGFGANGQAGTSTAIKNPEALLLLSNGELIFSDANRVIRKLKSDNTVQTIAGIGGPQNTSGNGGPALNAEFHNITGLALGTDGSIYVAARTVRRLYDNAGTLYIEGFAGSGTASSTSSTNGDGGAPNSAAITAIDVKVDSAGTVYILELNFIRYVKNGVIDTLFGGQQYGDCAMSASKGTAASQEALDLGLKRSMSNFCKGNLTAFYVDSTCSSQKSRMLMTQVYRGQASVVGVEHTCQ